MNFNDLPKYDEKIAEMVEDGEVIAYISYTDKDRYSHSATVTIYDVIAWGSDYKTVCGAEEVGVLFLKQDGCAHLGFRCPDMNNQWVHVCGPGQFKKYMRILEWAWKATQDIIPSYDKGERL